MRISTHGYISERTTFRFIHVETTGDTLLLMGEDDGYAPSLGLAGQRESILKLAEVITEYFDETKKGERNGRHEPAETDGREASAEASRDAEAGR